MNSDRIKEIQKQTGYPQSISVATALKQVWNECEQEQLSTVGVVSNFLENLKDSESRILFKMRERNQEEFIKWRDKNPYRRADDEWDNDILFIKDVAKYIENNRLYTLPLTEKITKIKYPIGGFATGHYMSKCINCDQQFIGDKRARQCEPCAINSVNESNTKALGELNKLKIALHKIQFSNNTINEVLEIFKYD